MHKEIQRNCKPLKLTLLQIIPLLEKYFFLILVTEIKSGGRIKTIKNEF